MAPARTEEKKLILVVEDSDDIRSAFAELLTEGGFRTSEAEDGQEGLDKARELQPDLIVMDLSLPVVDGWAATQQLKRDTKTSHIPVVIVTAYTSEGPRAMVQEGCDGFLIKPAAADSLVKEVQRVLARAA